MRGMNAVSGIKRLSGNPLRYLSIVSAFSGTSFPAVELVQILGSLPTSNELTTSIHRY